MSTPCNFLDLPAELSRQDAAYFHVIPAPYEATVSYGGGTVQGPEAILRASAQVEWFDGTSVPATAGIFTRDALELQELAAAEAVATVAAGVRCALRQQACPVVLGGEHTVSLGAVKACAEQYPGLGVVQFDAHTDLRTEYDDTPYNHACTARRIIDMGLPLFQIGTRSMSEEEHLFRRQTNILSLDAYAVCCGEVPGTVLPQAFSRDIYVTVDVDVLDPSVVPATGTPEPGGLNWYQTLDLFGKVVSGRNLVGFDIVELAPIPGFHTADFTVAKLTYMLMGIAWRNRNGGNRQPDQ